MSSTYWLDGFILVAALYLLYAGVIMKAQRKIPKSVMSPDMVKKCKDVDGFIDFLAPWTIAFAIVALVAGLLGLFFDALNVASWATYLTSGAFLIFFFVFMYFYRKGTKKYFD